VISCTICASEVRDQVTSALQRGLSLREVGRMFNFGPNVVHKHSKHVERMEQPTKAFVDQQIRVRAHREHCEQLLQAATAKNDLVSATRLLRVLADLDRRLLDSPAQRRQQQDTRVMVCYQGTDAKPYSAEAYINHVTTEIGWRRVLAIVFERMVVSGNVSAEIVAGMEKFIAIVEREDQVAHEIADSESP